MRPVKTSCYNSLNGYSTAKLVKIYVAIQITTPHSWLDFYHDNEDIVNYLLSSCKKLNKYLTVKKYFIKENYSLLKYHKLYVFSNAFPLVNYF